MNEHDDLRTLPYGDDDKVREGMIRSNGTEEKAIDYKAGTVLVRPGQTVDTLFLLIHGSIDLVRDMGTPNESRTSHSRNMHVAAGTYEWTPVLGGRYFFLKKSSSLHYVVTVPSKVLIVTPERIRKQYAARDCRKLVREMLRNSDMQLGVFLEELDKRFDTLRYDGFRKDDLFGLLLEKRGVAGEDIKREAYIDFACDMIFRLMGDMIAMPDDGSTKLSFDKPAVLR